MILVFVFSFKYFNIMTCRAPPSAEKEDEEAVLTAEGSCGPP